jgi:hypothetical protein
MNEHRSLHPTTPFPLDYLEGKYISVSHPSEGMKATIVGWTPGHVTLPFPDEDAEDMAEDAAAADEEEAGSQAKAYMEMSKADLIDMILMHCIGAIADHRTEEGRKVNKDNITQYVNPKLSAAVKHVQSHHMQDGHRKVKEDYLQHMPLWLRQHMKVDDEGNVENKRLKKTDMTGMSASDRKAVKSQNEKENNQKKNLSLANIWASDPLIVETSDGKEYLRKLLEKKDVPTLLPAEWTGRLGVDDIDITVTARWPTTNKYLLTQSSQRFSPDPNPRTYESYFKNNFRSSSRVVGKIGYILVEFNNFLKKSRLAIREALQMIEAKMGEMGELVSGSISIHHAKLTTVLLTCVGSRASTSAHGGW